MVSPLARERDLWQLRVRSLAACLLVDKWSRGVTARLLVEVAEMPWHLARPDRVPACLQALQGLSEPLLSVPPCLPSLDVKLEL